MKRLMKVFYLAAVLVPISVRGAAQAGNCNTGKLVDVQVNTRLIDAGTVEQVSRDSSRKYHSYSMPLTQQQTIYTITVQLADLIYTAQSQSVFAIGFKPTSFIVNDPIHACVKGDTLVLSRQDGRDFKARIVRTEREPQGKE